MTDLASVPPQPVPDADTAGFWKATGEGRVAMCHCQSCGLWMMPPLERCRRCAGATAFDEIAGTGTLYSFIVQWHHSVPGYSDQTPFVIGLVEIDEQTRVRIPGRVLGIDHGDVKCGMRVKAELAELPGGDYRVVVFRPVDPA